MRPPRIAEVLAAPVRGGLPDEETARVLGGNVLRALRTTWV
ncbi:hypothetical protein [Modestobacter altitudinis]|nr:hypothetical protein [Modestobacter altitudinis]